LDPVVELVEAVLAGRGVPARPLDVRLGAGERLVLEAAGEAGSAVLHAAVGLGAPRSGRVRVLGVEPASVSRAAHEAFAVRVGYLPRAGELVSNITLEANVLLPLAYHRRLAPAEVQRLGALAASRFGLEWPLPRRLPADVPLALRRRVALARAVALEPELLLLDDFTDDLARADAVAVADAVRVYAEARGVAVLCASDDPTLADRLGARRQSLEP
jgi:ABC-type transporter Mla maintaining outer membrane lipid asymmetry ATPase subunit MlaF